MSVTIGGVKVIKATNKAILVDIPGCLSPLWIPQSQIEDDSEVWKEGDEGDLVVTEWIAEKKDLL